MRKWDRKLVGFFTLVAFIAVISALGVLAVSAKANSAGKDCRGHAPTETDRHAL